MNFNQLTELYQKKKLIYGKETDKQFSNLLEDVKEIHQKEFFNYKTVKSLITKGKNPDYEKSWKAFKSKRLEKWIKHIVVQEVKDLGFSIVEKKYLIHIKKKKRELSLVTRNTVIALGGQYGFQLPNIDYIIYIPQTSYVLGVIAIRSNLKDCISEQKYWKKKLLNSEVTEHIKVYFITHDEDGTLTMKYPPKKGRSIVEMDTDGCYVLSETRIEESNKVKTFDKFIKDLTLFLK
jgi:type II restriction enzyme